MKVKTEAPQPEEPFLSESNFAEFFNQVKQESGTDNNSGSTVKQMPRKNLKFKKVGGKRRQDLFYEKSRHCEVQASSPSKINMVDF